MNVTHGIGIFFIGKDNGEDLFVHFNAIIWDGYRNLDEGQRVNSRSSKVKKAFMHEI